MKVSVFGAAGFVGRHVLNSLRKRNYEVLASDVVELPDNKIECEYKKIDILDEAAVKETVKGTDYVINLSAHPLRASIENPKKNAMINIIGSLNIMDAAREYKISKYVFTSASSVIGAPQFNPVHERHPCVPKTPYAVGKFAVENYARTYSELYGLKSTVFRLFNVYGPGQTANSGAVIPVMIEKIKKGEELTVFGDGSSTRDYIYVGDVADFIVHSLGSQSDANMFNLGTGRATSIIELIKLISEVVDKEPRIIHKPPQAGEIGNFYADTESLREHFNEIPSTPLKVGLESTYRSLFP